MKPVTVTVISIRTPYRRHLDIYIARLNLAK